MFLKASYKQQNGHKMFNLNKEDVVFVEQDGDYHNVYVSGIPFFINFHGNGAIVSERFPNLVKAHRSYFINPEKIFCLSHKPDNMVEIKFKDGKELTFSRSKTLHNDFIEKLEANAE
jgi:DNA-binding LytR/AlgR family response regulator